MVLRAFARSIRPGAVSFDIGANVGLFTLLAAARGAHVHAFEPLPRNLGFLRDHLRRNDLEGRANVIEAAVGRASGMARFQAEPTGLEGTLDPRGEGDVRVVALDDYEGPDPHVIKIDVEGSEADVLAGAVRTITRAQPTLFIELHSGASGRSCRASLEAWGYALAPLGDDRRFLALPNAGSA
jgi:FkbM family methyltransferase